MSARSISVGLSDAFAKVRGIKLGATTNSLGDLSKKTELAQYIVTKSV